jgi:glycosyltransferase involved in cell wall biosynthesis
VTTRLRIAAVASHPVQYQAPWYRALAQIADLHVFFAHRVTPEQHAQAGFNVPFEWDVPLLDGYAHEWLLNVAARPGVDRFRGCNTPDVAARIDSGHFDAVIVNGWQLLSYWQAVRAANRLRVPVFVRGDSHLRAEPRAVGFVKHVMYPRLLKAFDGFLAVGERNREYYRRYQVPNECIWRAPHCVDNEFFASAVRQAREGAVEPRVRLQLPADATVLLFAAKLIGVKRPLDFVRGVCAARAAGANVHGLIVGDGPLRGAVEDEVRRTTAPCTFTGFLNQREIGVAFAAADALVLPSDRETWGLIVNEAMAAGLPAFVSDAAGCTPDLVVNGVTGYVFPCGDVAALRQRLCDFGARAVLARLGDGAAAHIRSYSPAVAAEGVVAAVHATRARALPADEGRRHHATA